MYSQIHKLCEQPKNLVNGQDFEVKLIAARNCRETPEFVAYQSIKPFPSESFARCSKQGQGGLWKNCWRLESLYWSLLLHSFRFYCCILYQLWSGHLLNFLALAKFEARLFCLARTLALISFQLKVIIKTSVKLFEKYARSLIPILFTHCPSAAFHFAARSLAWLDPCVDSPLFSQSTIGYLQN